MLEENSVKALEWFSQQPSIKRILELGSGLMSTVAIAKTLRERGSGTLVSLEDDPEWYAKVQAEVKGNKRVKHLLKPFIFDGRILRYDYKCRQTFDLVVIDGPGMLTPEVRSAAVEKMAADTVTSKLQGGGMQSMHILDYIKPMIHNDTIIVVDGRRLAVLNYVVHHGQHYQFFGAGLKYAKLDRALRPEYMHLAECPVARATFIVSKLQSTALELAKANPFFQPSWEYVV